jgi:transposase InsO family protein
MQSPTRTVAQLEVHVLELRRQRQTGSAIARQLRMSRSTVYRILRRAGLSRLKALDPIQPVIRYEYRRPGDLLHIDTKKLVRIARVGHRIHGDRRTTVRGIGWEAVHVCVDDASRLAYVEVLDDETGRTSTGFLRRALAWYERHGIRVKRVMTDNGAAYRWSKSLFSQHCRRRRIRHLRTKAYRPQTNGKAERFIQTMLREWAYAAPYDHSQRRTEALPAWLTYYNRRRPHGSLAGQPPFSVFKRRRKQRV